MNPTLFTQDDWAQAIDRPEILRAEVCPYCGCKPVYVDSSIIYGRSYGMVYHCAPCDAYVGVHQGTNNPKGRLANRELRYWKKLAHSAFDPLWQNGHFRRQEAYAWLAKELEIAREYSHIGMFNCRMCQLTVDVIRLAKDLGEF